jgi:indolepyruvate ferredoxin oxidoreductase
MAYKDEYEVARLYTDGRFAAYRAETFKGGEDKVWLSPPILAPRDPEGRPKKLAFGGWMLNAAFPVLARARRLRGTPLDPFGRTHERRTERALIGEFEQALDRLAAELTPERRAVALKLAALPQQIRGFGHVKAAAIEQAKAEEARLWAEWEAVTAG